MKKSKAKKSIHIRIFSVFLATYLLLMMGFSAFLVFQEKKIAGKELGNYSIQISNTIVDILENNLDENNDIIDMPKVKKEFTKQTLYYPSVYRAEVALFSSDYDLIYSTNDYWRCSYTESVVGNTHYTGYGLLNPRDWFSEEEVKELEDYLFANPKSEKIGDLNGYGLSIEGFWMDDEMIIPGKIYITPMYVTAFDEYGNVSAARGTRNVSPYSSGYEYTGNLPYFAHGSILQINSNTAKKSQDELRQVVADPSNLKESIEQLPESISSIERVNALTYRYYTIVPYKSSITVEGDNHFYSDFWTAVGQDINLWERIWSTLVYVWSSCLMIFLVASYILSRQTYKTYLKQEKLEKQRKEMTDALAHDLKTPLSIISGYAQNLQEDIHSEKREHYASHIHENVNRMDRIIRKMLEMTRLESDSFDLKLEEVSLEEISTDIINRYKQLCDERAIRTSVEGDALVKADRSLIERVIDNFIINAIDHTVDEGMINIKILDDTLEVYNRGSHIPEEKIKEIWLPFKKGNLERSNTKGTGLGLSISRTILELHRFSYGAKNSEDGVIFWFKW